MNASIQRGARSSWVAARMLLAFTLVVGIGYTLVMTMLGQTLFGEKSSGSLLYGEDGEPVGSALIGQSFTDDDAVPLPEYFQSRPSAVDYEGAGSGGSNWGPENDEFITSVAALQDSIAAFEEVGSEEIPADAVTASSSGLDPHISQEYALIQAERVARHREVSLDEVTALVQEHTTGPDLGFLGNDRVNVLELNLALDQLTGER